MLKQKAQELPHILVFKTQAGEEFVAKVVEETAEFFKVDKPLCLVNTDAGVRFAPFLMMSDPAKPITIPKPIITAQPSEQVSGQYESITTGIALPQKSAIIV